MAETTSQQTLIREAGAGKLYDTGDELIQILQLRGSWRQMGRQYGAFAKPAMEQMWAATVRPVFDGGLTTEAEALDLFGRRPFETCSTRMKEFIRGIAEETGWSVDKVSLLSQGGVMAGYQKQIHSFSGCSSIAAWGAASRDGTMVTARNLDWGELFLEFPVFLTVFNPDDGSNGFANLNFPGWLWIMTALNDRGVYMDLHDGTSMGGGIIHLERASFLTAMVDLLAECDDAEAVSRRLNSLRNDVAFIWTVADASPTAFSFECPAHDSRRRNSADDTLVVVNTYLLDDWGIGKRETMSNSIRRHDNLAARLAEARGTIDADKAMDIFDLPLFNEDGTFREGGGATKPTKQDADLTDHQMVTTPDDLQIWIKIPLRTEWRHVDLKALFRCGKQPTGAFLVKELKRRPDN